MSLLASLALSSFALFAPQGDPTGRGPLLAPADHASLRDKLIKYLDADDAYERATQAKDRERTGKAREKAKEAFDKEWDRCDKKANQALLGSMADLRPVFDNCFLVKAPSGSLATLRSDKVKEDGTDFSYFVPKAYKADKATRTVIVLPGTVAPGTTTNWVKPADWFASVWDKTNALNDTIFHLVHVKPELEMDPVPDFGREADEKSENERYQTVFSGFRQTTDTFNVDRSRVFLDCARGNCGFGLRFATMFPDRFAGLILRDPVAVDDIRLGTLTGLPVLLLKSAANAAVVDALKQKLDALAAGAATVLETTDDYPHKAAAPEIEKWLASQRRNMSPKKVVIEPNHDRFNRAYWVDIDRAEPLGTSAADAKPRLEVEADRAANRITVKARGVESFVLFLNDDLVDLDKEFTVVVNDKAVTEKKTRSFRMMLERMLQRRDWDYLFPVVYNTSVPKQ